MKKYRNLSIILSLLLFLQCLTQPAFATEAGTGETETESTEESVETTPVAAFGDTPIYNGCRTIEAQYPLGGSDRMLTTAQSAFVYEMNTNTLIYSYNPDKRLPPGSLSKILTALIAIEEGNLNDVITVSTREISRLPFGSLVADLKEGEQVTLRDVLHCLLLASANDAALIVAQHITGNEISFVEKMNERLAELGCTNTYLTNCHGLDDPQQYTTARDMARITMAAYQNPTFAEIFKTTRYTIPPTNRTEEEHLIESGNHLIYERILNKFNDVRVTGGMPSYVSVSSGASICFTAEDNGMKLVFVIMGCSRTYKENGWQVDRYGNFEEALDLLEYTFSGYKINRLLYKEQPLSQFIVNGGECNVVACSDTILDTVLPASAKMDNMKIRYTLKDGALTAPIADGQEIGSVQIWYNSSCLAETEIYAMNGVKALDNTGVEIYGATRDDSDFGDILSFLGILLLVVLVPFACYVGYNHLRVYLRRNRRRRRRANRRRSR